MARVVTLPIANPLVGTWGALDENGTTVEYTVTPTSAGLMVIATDTYDNELGQVSQVEQIEGVLSFTVKWSTGRICKCSMHAATRNQVQFTFRYTEHGHLQRRSLPHDVSKEDQDAR